MSLTAAVRLPVGSRLVLASNSPRRRELLAGVGFDFEVRPADIDESPLADEAPTDYVRRLSTAKASDVAGPGEIVIAADTTVEVDGAILEKPIDDDDARRMLRLLSGRTHHAHTAVTVAGEVGPNTIVVTTAVSFVPLTDEVIDWYVTTGEANDKAGAYGIQGAAGAFVERIDGSVTNVIGLPLAETLALLRAAATEPSHR
jgi:septum formation protein